MATTIQVEESTKRQLEALKGSPRQTYEEVIEELLELAREDDAGLTPQTKKAIRMAREDIKRGRVYTTRQLIKELGI
jgi:phosphoserine phosphatase